MRVLLDTNILIHREAAHVVRDDIGLLFNWLDRLRCTKCVHPASLAEIEKHADERTRFAFQRKLQSYHQLQAPAALRPEVHAMAQKFDVTPSDAIDTQLLNELIAGSIDLLISEDRGIWRKAQQLGIDHRVFAIGAFLEKVIAENPDLIEYTVLAVRRDVFGRVDIAQPFFDSFRADYPGFDGWFAQKSDEPVYVCYEKSRLVSFMYLKVEDEREAYSDIAPQMRAARRLKIGSLKVELDGLKLGERFLKIAFDNALRQCVEEVYVTVFRRSPAQKRLVHLLKDFGFGRFGEKRGAGGVEDVYVRSMEPRFDAQNPRLTFPFISRQRPWYIVPIHPEYHTTLLPDSILRTESPADFVEQAPHRNAIRKIYVSRSVFRDLQIGDAIVFYRTGGYHRSVITSIGIVDAVHLGVRDEEQFIRLCRQRSVFTDQELARQWNDQPGNRPFAVEFLYAHAFRNRPNMAALIDAGVIADVGSAPRGFERLSPDKVTVLLRLAEADPRLIVD